VGGARARLPPADEGGRSKGHCVSVSAENRSLLSVQRGWLALRSEEEVLGGIGSSIVAIADGKKPTRACQWVGSHTHASFNTKRCQGADRTPTRQTCRMTQTLMTR
jgi:hypothetical protein